MPWLHSKFLQFKHDEKGLAFLEFALCMPLILALLTGAIEVTRYILIAQKAEKTAVTISDVVAQAQTISNADLNNIILAAGQLMQPFGFGADGYVIITSVTQNGSPDASNPPRVNWQHRGGGTWTQPSKIGSTGDAATLPDDLGLNDRDNIIIAEVFYNYKPLIFSRGLVDDVHIYKMGLYKTRLGDLSTLSKLETLHGPYKRVVL